MSATFAATFALLYVAHLLADYPLQTDWEAAHKAEPGDIGWIANITHAITHVIVSAILLGIGDVVGVINLDVPALVALGVFAWIGVTHALIDRRKGVLWWMRTFRQEKFREHGGAHHVDQTAHITALALAALVLAVV